MMAADHSSDACEAPAILHLVPEFLVDDRFVLAVIDRSLVDDLAVIDRVHEQVEQATMAEREAI